LFAGLRVRNLLEARRWLFTCIEVDPLVIAACRDADRRGSRPARTAWSVRVVEDFWADPRGYRTTQPRVHLRESVSRLQRARANNDRGLRDGEVAIEATWDLPHCCWGLMVGLE
jgi:hypothetical protein